MNLNEKLKEIDERISAGHQIFEQNKMEIEALKRAMDARTILFNEIYKDIKKIYEVLIENGIFRKEQKEKRRRN